VAACHSPPAGVGILRSLNHRTRSRRPVEPVRDFPVAPLEADDFFFLRYGLIEVYHWLITKRVHAPA
jgi:hypothetical protein